MFGKYFTEPYINSVGLTRFVQNRRITNRFVLSAMVNVIKTNKRFKVCVQCIVSKYARQAVKYPKDYICRKSVFSRKFGIIFTEYEYECSVSLSNIPNTERKTNIRLTPNYFKYLQVSYQGTQNFFCPFLCKNKCTYNLNSPSGKW